MPYSQDLDGNPASGGTLVIDADSTEYDFEHNVRTPGITNGAILSYECVYYAEGGSVAFDGELKIGVRNFDLDGARLDDSVDTIANSEFTFDAWTFLQGEIVVTDAGVVASVAPLLVIPNTATQGQFKLYGFRVRDVGAARTVAFTSIKTSAYTAAAFQRVRTDTTGGSFTVTLPGSPQDGDWLEIEDTAAAWATNALTIARNGNDIIGKSENMTCSVIKTTGGGWRVSLEYDAANGNWNARAA